MNAYSKIDMAEVTLLTRAGKLAEAMAVLQGQTTSSPDLEAPPQINQRRSPTIDMAAPTGPGGAWTVPSEPRAPADVNQGGNAETSVRFARPTRAFNNRLFKKRPFSGEGAVSVPVPPGARFEERSFSNDAGSRTYKVYVPSGYAGQSLPVVVMLHGCTQNPDDFAAGTRMNALAEEQTFLVAYPRQPKSANMNKCWNWFNAEDQRREGGEPTLIAAIARQVVEEFSADPRRVYVAGLSAGGAAAAIMAATHPDVFAAVGVHSGLACGAAKDMPSAFAAMAAGGIVRPRGAGKTVPTIVFHGDADRTVNLVNADQVVAQAAPKAALSEVVTRGATPDGMTYTRTVQRDAAGKELLEQWVLHGAGHAWSGGSVNGSFADSRGPDASREMLRFFLQHENEQAGVSVKT